MFNPYLLVLDKPNQYIQKLLEKLASSCGGWWIMLGAEFSVNNGIFSLILEQAIR